MENDIQNNYFEIYVYVVDKEHLLKSNFFTANYRGWKNVTGHRKLTESSFVFYFESQQNGIKRNFFFFEMFNVYIS